MSFITEKIALNKNIISPSYYLDVSGNINIDGSIFQYGNLFSGGEVSKAYIDGSLNVKTDFTYDVKQDASIGLKTDFTYDLKQDASIVIPQPYNIKQDASIALNTTHRGLSTNPHGATLTQTTINANAINVGTVYNAVGSITGTGAVTIIEDMDAADMYIITATGQNKDYANDSEGHGVWLATCVWDSYSSVWKAKVSVMYTSSAAYTNKIIVAASGVNVTIQYAKASTGNNTLYWSCIRLR